MSEVPSLAENEIDALLSEVGDLLTIQSDATKRLHEIGRRLRELRIQLWSKKP